MKFKLNRKMGSTRGRYRVMNGDEVLIESIRGTIEEIGVLVAINFGDKYFGCEMYEARRLSKNCTPVFAIADKEEFDEKDPVIVAATYLTYHTREKNGLYRVVTDERGTGHAYDEPIGSQEPKPLIEEESDSSMMIKLMSVDEYGTHYILWYKLSDVPNDILQLKEQNDLFDDKNGYFGFSLYHEAGGAAFTHTPQGDDKELFFVDTFGERHWIEHQIDQTLMGRGMDLFWAWYNDEGKTIQ